MPKYPGVYTNLMLAGSFAHSCGKDGGHSGALCVSQVRCSPLCHSPNGTILIHCSSILGYASVDPLASLQPVTGLFRKVSTDASSGNKHTEL